MIICSKYYPHLQDFDLVIVEPRLICLSCVRVREFPEKNQLVVDHLGITTSQILHHSNLVRGATLIIIYSLGAVQVSIYDVIFFTDLERIECILLCVSL